MEDFLMQFEEYFAPNSTEDVLMAIIWFFAILAGFLLVKNLLLFRLKKLSASTENSLDDEIVGILTEVPLFFYFVVAFYFPLNTLILPSSLETLVLGIFLIVLVYEMVKVVQRVIEYYLRRSMQKKDKHVFSGLLLIIKIILWSVGLLLILSNLGINITSLVASLGIGGVAIALAVQNILEDIFSSFSIYFDKPFEVGDFIIVGEDVGTVKKIGIKTSRITALDGEEIVISNKELTSARVRNFKKLQRRRIVMPFGLVYGTSNKNLEKANAIVKKVIDGVNEVEFDRCHFKSFGAYSLDFEVVYYVLSNEYAVYMECQQEINLGIKKEFEKAKIEMAFPTQTLELVKN